MIAVLEPPEKIKEAMEIIEGMMQDGLIVTSDVDVVRLVHSYPSEEEASDGTNPIS